jgi:hypothetical protein
VRDILIANRSRHSTKRFPAMSERVDDDFAVA